MPSSLPDRCWAEIDLCALHENVRRIRQNLPPETRVISVVKANCYGAGVAHAVPVLKAAGAAMFGVANVTEAIEVRGMDSDSPILLLSATVPGEEDSLFEYNLTPTVSTLEEVVRYQDAARRRNQSLPVHLKFDTGMGRLGIWHERAEELLAAANAAPLLEIRGLYSHFASAGEDLDFTNLQRQRLLTVLEQQGRPDDRLWIHIDNSYGLPSLPAGGLFNAVRVGLLQFGITPPGAAELAHFGVSPVVSLHARVTVVKDLPKGAGISYGSTHILKRASRVAVLTAGYADGILRADANAGEVLIRGRRCPILGNVTMDEIVVDVTDLPSVACGDRATFFGCQENDGIDIYDYSRWRRTIPWEALCALSKRVRRIYRPWPA